MIKYLFKSNSRPNESVKAPSSNSSKKKLNTGLLAFSNSSINIILDLLFSIFSDSSPLLLPIYPLGPMSSSYN